MELCEVEHQFYHYQFFQCTSSTIVPQVRALDPDLDFLNDPDLVLKKNSDPVADLIHASFCASSPPVKKAYHMLTNWGSQVDPNANSL